MDEVLTLGFLLCDMVIFGFGPMDVMLKAFWSVPLPLNTYAHVSLCVAFIQNILPATLQVMSTYSFIALPDTYHT